MSNQNKGFWVRFLMEYGRGNTKKDETYEFLEYDAGYKEDDDISLKSLSEDWCQNENGWAYEYYKYGYEIVNNPPIEWIQEELNRLKEEENLITEKKKLLQSVMEKL